MQTVSRMPDESTLYVIGLGLVIVFLVGLSYISTKSVHDFFNPPGCFCPLR